MGEGSSRLGSLLGALLLLGGVGGTPGAAAAGGFDAEGMREALALGQAEGKGSIMVHVGGAEAASSGSATAAYDLKSTTKSYGGLLLCLALDDGRVGLATRGSSLVDGFGQPSTAEARDVTVRQLATHTAGFDKPGGFVRIIREPGTAFAYSDGGANWLADVLTAAYRQDMAALFRARIGGPIGAAVSWRSNGYRPGSLNGVPRREFGSGIRASVASMARVGDLLLAGGRWKGRQIISSGCVRDLGGQAPGLSGLPVATPFTPGASRHYGLLWWNNADGSMGGVPRDAFWSWGLGDSFILVVPSRDLVVARAGRAWQRGWKADYRVLEPFFRAVVAAVR